MVRRYRKPTLWVKGRAGDGGGQGEMGGRVRLAVDVGASACCRGGVVVEGVLDEAGVS